MYEQVEKAKETKSSAVANSVAQKKSSVKQGFGFVVNRSEAIAQRKQEDVISNHSQAKKTIQRNDAEPYNVFPYWNNRATIIGELHSEIPLEKEIKFWQVYNIHVIYEAFGFLSNEEEKDAGEQKHMPVDDHKMKFYMFVAAFDEILDEMLVKGNYEDFNQLKTTFKGMKPEMNSIEQYDGVDEAYRLVSECYELIEKDEPYLTAKPIIQNKQAIIKGLLDNVIIRSQVFKSDAHETDRHLMFAEIRTRKMVENILGMINKLPPRSIIKLGQRHVKHITAAVGVVDKLKVKGVEVVDRETYKKHLPHLFKKEGSA